MHVRRVVVTGMGAVSPFGRGVPSLMNSLMSGESAVRRIPGLEQIQGLRSLVAAEVQGIDGKEIPRKFRRSMSPMSIFATLAASEAVAASHLCDEVLSGGRLGVSIGSTIGSPVTTQAFFEQFVREKGVEQMKSTVFFQMMNHSAAANVAQALGVRGRILAPSAACATGCQAVGYGYEMIAWGKQDYMLCGGADEIHPLTTATFDLINAASTHYNDRPEATPRPFDKARDGVVCSEGAACLLLESLDSALMRNAPICAEVLGFATVSDTSNIANPDSAAVRLCMEQALADAQVGPDRIDYVNAHATGTEAGDVAESEAISVLLGPSVPVSSLKGHLGHSMAASGALEMVATIAMMTEGRIIPTRNLDEIDDRCSGIRHVQKIEERNIRTALKNNFALGGVNACIVLGRYGSDR